MGFPPFLRLLLPLSFMFINGGCRQLIEKFESTKTQIEKGLHKRRSIDENDHPPTRWQQHFFPLQVEVAENFTEEEVDAINAMATAWEDSVSRPHALFQMLENSPVPPYSNTMDFHDNILGIYKLEDWFPQEYAQALAITQYFGFLLNAGTEEEVLTITHADILINKYNFSFSAHPDPITSAGKYDLATVILQEMGHFLGLPHSPLISDSIMRPYMRLDSLQRAPRSKDQLDLQKLYGFSPSTPGTFSSLPEEEEEDENDPHSRIPVRGVIELFPNGECRHRQLQQTAVSNRH